MVLGLCLDCYDDFSELVVALQIAVNVYHFIEFKRPVDEGLECATGPAALANLMTRDMMVFYFDVIQFLQMVLNKLHSGSVTSRLGLPRRSQTSVH
jgi:hypothetical protein